jgi:muramoyltetrapeptide carboxypeptidase LdcA involved in peptidoglycan recycling
MTRMAHDLVHPPKARRGERIAVLCPSFAAAGAFPAVHEQAMRRLTEVTGLVPVEYPTTREVGASALESAADINAAFADPSIRGILAVIGGEDQIGPDVLDGAVLLLETSEELLPARNVGWIVRSLGERGVLAAAGAVLLARPPVSDFTRRPPAAERARLRAEQRDVAVEIIGRYNPQAVVCAGILFGHTRPQWILPHGGRITVDGATRRVTADYS